MKNYIIIIYIIIATALLSAGCVEYPPVLEGKYTGVESNITFFKDGTFITDFKDYSLGGDYKIRDHQVTIKYGLMGVAYTLNIVDNRTLEYQGSTWVKNNIISIYVK